MSIKKMNSIEAKIIKKVTLPKKKKKFKLLLSRSYNLFQFIELKIMIFAAIVKTKDENVKMRKIASAKAAKTAKTSMKKAIKKFVPNSFERIERKKFLQIAQAEFNLNFVQTRFLKAFVANEDDLTNDNLMIVLFMFKSVINKIVKKRKQKKKKKRELI